MLAEMDAMSLSPFPVVTDCSVLPQLGNSSTAHMACAHPRHIVDDA